MPSSGRGTRLYTARRTRRSGSGASCDHSDSVLLGKFASRPTRSAGRCASDHNGSGARPRDGRPRHGHRTPGRPSSARIERPVTRVAVELGQRGLPPSMMPVEALTLLRQSARYRSGAPSSLPGSSRRRRETTAFARRTIRLAPLRLAAAARSEGIMWSWRSMTHCWSTSAGRTMGQSR